MKPKPQGLEGSLPPDLSHPYRHQTPAEMGFRKSEAVPCRRITRAARKKAAVAATPMFAAEGWDDWRRLFGAVKQAVMFQE